MAPTNQTPTTMTAKEAVERSISHDEIVTIQAADWAEANALVPELQTIAFEGGLEFYYAFTGHRYETWAIEDGSDKDMEWCVHIEVEAQ